MVDLATLIEQKAEEYTPRVLNTLGREGYRQVYIEALKEEIAYVMETRQVASIDDLSSEHWRTIKVLGHGTAMRRIEAMIVEKKAREAQKLKVGDTSEIEVNQGLREAWVLAVIGDEALIEYEMPRGTTALWIVDAYFWGYKRNVSYSNLPTRWLKAMIDEGVEWTHRPQGSIRKQLGPYTWELRYSPETVKEMYAKRAKPKTIPGILFAE